MAPILKARNITKTFPGVIANQDVSFALQEGEVLAFLGENGAGKSTLMNVLYGLYAPDEGEVFVRGERVTIKEPRHAIDLGIGMVHQHFQLIAPLTVAENVMLGAEVSRQGFLDHQRVAEEIRVLSQRYNLAVDPETLVGELPVGIQQRVEIIKTLYRRADILILDEPTAVLTPQEIEGLFEIVGSLVREGKSVIFISHKLKEVLTIADRIVVLRDGRVVGETRPAETDELQLAAMMVGREVILKVDKTPAMPQNVVLYVKDLHALDERRHPALNGISFEVRAGEILGIAGVQGNGQTELVEVLTGLRPATEGDVRIMGTDVTNVPPRTITELGTAHVPEDRHKDGLVLSAPICDNLILCTYYQPPFARGVVMQEDKIVENAEARVKEFDVRTPSVFLPAESLSGGNQQKVIMARELSRPIKLLIAAQPTRGLDVGSIEFIHRRLVEKRDEGTAVLLVSSELDEIMALSDRIAVIYEGRIVATLPVEEAERAQLGLLMAGAQLNEAQMNA
ncbi:MAG: heme ABC transporter ATP-binding protein [Anaerolineaceae bacterium 4572_32.1]|nr:MAG: heme ABC transporter ATP-binding protein [Anaerolineaceae bacterium 4572_32.1]